MHKILFVTFIFSLSLGVSGCATSSHDIVNNSAPIAPSIVASIEASGFYASQYKASDGTLLPYRLLTPANMIQGKRYPLVLQLHGSGGIGTDNLKQLDRLAKTWAMPDLRERYQAYVLIPQFQIRSANYGEPSPDQHAEHSTALIAALELLEDFASNHAVDKSRIYALGFSMGGSAAWLAPTLKPNLFAAVVPISGIAPANSFASIFKDLPVYVIHGNSDTENPITADRRFVSEVMRIGGKNIQFREYEGLEHQLSAEIYPGYWWRDWLFKQKNFLFDADGLAAGQDRKAQCIAPYL